MASSIRGSPTAASRSTVPPEAAPEGAPYEEDADRPFHAVAGAVRPCWYSSGQLALYLTKSGSQTFGFCIRPRGFRHPLRGVRHLLHSVYYLYLIEAVDTPEQQRKIQPLRCFTFIGSRDLLRRTLERSFLEQVLHGVQHNSNFPTALGRVLLPPLDELVHKGSPSAQVT